MSDQSTFSSSAGGAEFTAAHLEDAVQRCMRRPVAERRPALDAMCLLYPEHAETIRRRFKEISDSTIGESKSEPAEASFFMNVSLYEKSTTSESMGDSGRLPAVMRAPLPQSTSELEFVRELGRGGMGVVYEARDKNSGRSVAVKVISPHLRLSTSAIDRFDREARIAARMSHPNCVFVYGAYRVEGRPALSMELMSGNTLDDVVRNKRRVPIETVVGWGIEILNGLEAAHALGIVHRDIKPSNLFLDADGRVKIGDFGLSLQQTSDLKLTRSGTFLGSPLYASPEQIRGRDVDVRSDIYSVGATLYALATGQVPHDASNIGDLFARITTEAIKPPWEIRDDLPREFGRVVMKALEREPENRYADAHAMREALRPFHEKKFEVAPLPVRVVAYVLDTVMIATLAQIAFQMIRFQLGWQRRTFDFRVLEVAVFFSSRCLYFGLFEGLIGASIGKLICGLRVARGSLASVGVLRATARAALFYPEYLVTILAFPELLGPLRSDAVHRVLKLLVGFLPFAKPNYRTGFHEVLTDTTVVRLNARTTAMRRRLLRPFEPERSRLVQQAVLGEHVRIEAEVSATEAGMIFVGRDLRLDREVWVHVVRSPELRLDATLRSRVDPHALRWLDGADAPEAYDIFESPGGASLAEYAEHEEMMPWSLARTFMIELARRLATGKECDSRRIWVDGHGALKILDFDLLAVPEIDRPVEWAAEVLLPKRASDQLLPGSARSVVARLQSKTESYTTIGPMLGDLEATDANMQTIGRVEGLAIASFRAVAIMIILSLIGVGLFLLSTYLIGDEFSDVIPGMSNESFYDLCVLGAVIVPAILFGRRWRGGLIFRALGIRVVTMDGQLASPNRCSVRSIVMWLPAVLALAVHLALDSWIEVAMFASIAIYVLSGAWILVSPSRTPADIITKTQLVR